MLTVRDISSKLKNTIYKFYFKGMYSVHSFDHGRNVFHVRQTAPKLTWVDANCMVSIFPNKPLTNKRFVNTYKTKAV